MKANEVALQTFLSQPKTQFVIPVYQRNYDWTEHQCEQLFRDILEVGARPGATHFIGSIVFIHDGLYTTADVRQLVVIDGQQRLTTITVLYLAIHKRLKEYGRYDLVAEIDEMYIRNKFAKSDGSKLKLKQSDVNAKALSYLLNENDPSRYPEYSRVIENYKYFSEQVSRDNVDTILTGLSRLIFVEISLERGKDDPQRIFESLNSTGLELSQADLIRNYILMGLEPEEQVRVFSTYWEVIESNARDNDREESRISDFIRDYLTYKMKKIPNKDKVYEEFKLRYSVRHSSFYSATLEELKELSFHYNKLLNPDQEPDVDLRKELRNIHRLEVKISFPFLLPVYDDYEKGILPKEDFLRILKLIQSFVWRRFIVELPTNALNKIFMTLYSDVDKSDYVASIERSLLRKRGAQRFPQDSEIEEALLVRDVYNTQARNRTYFLELLENHNNREYVHVDNPDITVEHIFPQTPNPKWYDLLSQEDFTLLSEKYLNTIANLTLSGNNGSLGNKTFAEKKVMNRDGGEQGYIYSRLWLNQYLKGISEWNVSTLMERCKILLERFFEIWPYPDVELEDEFDYGEEYNVFNAPDPTNRKLEYYIFRDEKIVTDEMVSMYGHVIKALYDENPSVFHHPDIKELIGMTSNREGLRSAYQISTSHYIETGLNNSSKLKKLRLLLSRLDATDDLLIKFAPQGGEGADLVGVDRSYWIKKCPAEMMAIVDECVHFLQVSDPVVDVRYTRFHIGVSRESKRGYFIRFMPRKDNVLVSVRVADPHRWLEELGSAGFQRANIHKRNGRLRFRIFSFGSVRESELLKQLLRQAVVQAGAVV